MSNLKKFEDKELSIVKIDHIKSLKGAGVTLEEIVKNNPFIEPDHETIGECEKSRKALKLGRTTVSRFAKEIKSGLNSAGRKIEEIASDMRSIVEAAEQKQELANNVFFDEQAYNKALEVNTKSAFVLYLENFGTNMAAKEKIKEFEDKEEAAKKEYNDWAERFYSLISNATSIEEIHGINKELDNIDLDKFINPSLAFDQREIFFNLIDEKETALNKAEIERKAAKEKAEADRVALEKRQKELEESRKQQAEAAKVAQEKLKAQQAEAEKNQKAFTEAAQKENYSNSIFILETIESAIDQIKDVDSVNIFNSKIDRILDTDFGDKKRAIIDLCEPISNKLTSKRLELVAEIQKEKVTVTRTGIGHGTVTGIGFETANGPAPVLETQKEEIATETVFINEKKAVQAEIESELRDILEGYFDEAHGTIEKYSLKNDIVNFIETLI